MFFTLDSHSLGVEVRCLNSVAHFSCMEDHWPLTDFLHLFNICMSESDCEGEEVVVVEGEGMKVSISDSGRVGSVDNSQILLCTVAW